MSSDTELTFVRCPSCRSLVPALSTRCRMCGASLDHNKDGKGKEEKTSEVKESTTKKYSNGNVSNKIAAEKTVDPLSEYLDELDDDLKNETTSDDFEEDKFEDDSDNSSDDSENTDDEDAAIAELDALLEELKAMDNKSSKNEAKALSSKKEEFDEDDFEEFESLAKDDEEAIEVQQEKQTLSKDEDFEDDFQEEEIKAKEVLQPKAKASSSFIATGPKVFNPKQSTTKVQAPIKTVVDSVKSSPLKQTTTQSNLFGWFVGFEKPQGESFEIREGKFFVSKSSLKKTDLIIDEDSISTPHAMITEIGFQIQDLMSEQGVYIKRAGDSTYQLIEDIEVVENGDWIRFGKVEYLVVFVR